MESSFLLEQERPTHGQKKKKTFGFKTSYFPPQIPELDLFEKDLSNLVNLIKFRTNINSFRKQLNKGIRKIRESTFCWCLLIKLVIFIRCPSELQ